MYPDGTFLGEVPVSELITGDVLASAIGLTSGISQNSTESWLKWIIDGKTVLYSKRPYRYGNSWDQLQVVNAVDGSRTLVIQGQTYAVSLPKGTNPDPEVTASSGYDVPYSWHSEWNRLMYPIVQATAQNPKLSQRGPDQATYTETDLVLVPGGGNGYYQWCREVVQGQPMNRVMHGGDGVSLLDYANSSSDTLYIGWRPRLELVA